MSLYSSREPFNDDPEPYYGPWGRSAIQGGIMSTVNLRRIIDAEEFEGIPFKVTGLGIDIEPGDTYLAERNSGVKLFTCKSHNREKNWIVPVEEGYYYDTWECVRIEFKEEA